MPSTMWNGPEQDIIALASYLRQAGIAPQQGATAPVAAQPAQQPAMQQSAPAAAPASTGGGFFSGLSNMLGGGGAQNQTVQWLQSQGLDPSSASIIARDKPTLQKYLLQKATGGGLSEFDQRAQAAIQLGVDPNSEEGRTFILTGNLPQKGDDYSFITGRDGSIFRADRGTGKVEPVYGGQPDQPTSVEEYNFYVDQETKSGRQPRSYDEWKQAQSRAGATSVNVNGKAESAFDTELAKGQAQLFNTMSTEGLNARADLAVIDRLGSLMQGRGGSLDGIKGWLSGWGVDVGEATSDLQAADALINKLVPTQRQPGSGTMSDRDVEMFRRSLPSLWNQPGGNKIILDTMKGLVQYKQAQGEIADMVMAGEISRQEARKMLREIPNPLADFKKDIGGFDRDEVEKYYNSQTPNGKTSRLPAPQAERFGGGNGSTGQPAVTDWKEWLAPGRSKR